MVLGIGTLLGISCGESNSGNSKVGGYHINIKMTILVQMPGVGLPLPKDTTHLSPLPDIYQAPGMLGSGVT